MNVGTKSILFGVHQFIWHPITVFLAWVDLYGFPDWKELTCIIIHDWGYWGSPNMDGEEGEQHPEFGAAIAHNWFDGKVYVRTDNYPRELGTKATFPTPSLYWRNFCLYHSRHYAKRHGMKPSKLCWADKLSIKYDPWWLYLPRAWLSGELTEYRSMHSSMGEDFKTHREWYNWASDRAIRMGYQQNSDGISFHPEPGGHPERKCEVKK